MARTRKQPVNAVRTEEPVAYAVSATAPTAAEVEKARKLAVLAEAQSIMEDWYNKDWGALSSPEHTRDYLKIKLGPMPYEVFACIFIDNRSAPIAYEELFRGTIDGSSVHPREVVRRALELNAAAVIFVHNHPSGSAEPSQADLRITQRLKECLGLFEIRVLDHMIVGERIASLAEHGLL